MLANTAERLVRTHYENFPLKGVVISPEENYRWGSTERMEADLAAMEVVEGKTVNSFENLMESIQKTGIREPVGLVARSDGFHVIFGFTRLVACRKLGRETIPAYVYDESVSTADIRLLQLAENSAAAKRSVSWISETDAYVKLVKELADYYTSVPAGERPLNEAGRPAAPAQAAADTASVAIGRSRTTMRDRKQLLARLNPKVREMAVLYNWSYNTCLETVSADASAPYSDVFIEQMLNRLTTISQHEGFSLSNTLPTRIRRAKKDVSLTMNMYAAGCAPTTNGERARDLSGSILSPGSIRDVCIDLVASTIKARGMDTTSATAIEELKRTAAWHRIVGLGIAIGKVDLPACAVTRVMPTAEDNSAALNKQHENSANQWGVTVAVEALTRIHLDKTLGSRWINGISSINSRSVMHRAIVNEAVSTALSHYAQRGGTILDTFNMARQELHSRIPKGSVS